MLSFHVVLTLLGAIHKVVIILVAIELNMFKLLMLTMLADFALWIFLFVAAELRTVLKADNE